MGEYKKLSDADIGQQKPFSGYVTTTKSLLVAGSSPSEVERSLGYTPGSLREGYWFLRLSPSATIGEGGFEFRGYTHLEDGVPAGDTQNVHDQLMSGYSSHSVDQDTRKKLLNETRMRLNATGADRICRIVPVSSQHIGYKPGSGIVQFRLSLKVNFTVLARVNAGERLIRKLNDSIHVIT